VTAEYKWRYLPTGSFGVDIFGGDACRLAASLSRISLTTPKRVSKLASAVIVYNIQSTQQCAVPRSMSKSLEERVDYAVSQLIERTVPIYPEDDEELSEQRLDEAYNFARELLGRYLLWS